MSQVSSYILQNGLRTHAPVGRVLFTGPDDVRNHRSKVLDPTYVGRAAQSPEATGDLQYLYRAPKSCPPPATKSSRAGEIGWGASTLSDFSVAQTGHQIQLKTFRQANEDRYTHRYQAPYYPAPHVDQHTATGHTVDCTTPEASSSTVSNEELGH